MRNVFLFMMVSTDGYFEGPNRDLSWHNVDDEFNDFAVKQLDEADTLIMGRKTYELMAGYWPTPQGQADDTAVADRMNSYRKIVFSRTLKQSPWTNTEMHSDDPRQIITAAKAEPGKSIAVLGSSNLCLSLLEHNLIDELRLMISPVVLGAGTPLFAGIKQPLHLSLDRTRQFRSGNELLIYTPSSSK